MGRNEMQEVKQLVFHRRASAKEVRKALKTLKLRKEVGPDGIPIEVWKCRRD